MDAFKFSDPAPRPRAVAIAWPRPVERPADIPDPFGAESRLPVGPFERPFPYEYETRAPDPLPGRSTALPIIAAALSAELSPAVRNMVDD